MASPLNVEITGETKLFDSTQVRLGVNIADKLTPQKEQEIWMYMLEQYIRPQIDARRPYERMWNLLYDAYRMRLKIEQMKLKEDEKQFIQVLIDRMKAQGNHDMTITDSLIFDTVDRLSNLTHFISWKDGKPIQFGSPEDYMNPIEDLLYSPTEHKNKSQNAILAWNLAKEKAYKKSRLAYRDYYLFGFTYSLSDLYFKIGADNENRVFLQDIGVTYQPLSVRKVWIDWRMPISEMDQQPCPFWFDMVPIYNILRNPYEMAFNPMGYVNLDKAYEVCKATDWSSYFYGGESWAEGIKQRLESMGSTMSDTTYTKIKAKWVFLPMLPLDPQTGEFGEKTIKDGKKVPIPFRRFIMEVYSHDIISNKIVMLRLQDVEEHYKGQLPLYGATHLEDLSSAAYSMSICEALINSACEITLCMNYALENKNLINNPPTQHVVGSPSLNADVNKPNAKVEVMAQNDFQWRPVPDATQTTMGIANGIRDKAQATGRVTESIMGRALGGRTTAREAGNIFETSMSQITTDINILNDSSFGAHAERVYTAIARWLDPDLVKKITGSYGWPITDADLRLKYSLRTNVGTRYLTELRKQQEIQYMLQAAVQTPYLDQPTLWKEYVDVVGMPALKRAVIDGGRDREIAKAHEQVMKTYLDEIVIIDPGQNHELAVQVKTRFIEDTDSDWNTKYGVQPYRGTRFSRLMALSQQVAIHQNYILVQQQMAAAIAMRQGATVIAEQSAIQNQQIQQTQQP